MFDLEKASKQAKVGKKDFERIKLEVKKEFPDNPSLYEIHVVRYLASLKRTMSKK